MSTFILNHGTLTLNDTRLLEHVPESISALPAPDGDGVLLRFSTEAAAAKHLIDLGQIVGMTRFVTGSRDCPWWMLPATGTTVAEVPLETQFMLAELADGNVALFLPLLDGWFRGALRGEKTNHLTLVAETGDAHTVGREVTALFIAVGDDPYALMNGAAHSVMSHMRTGRLRDDKPVPDILGLFGWCTWDAFYQDVSHDKVIEGLESFQKLGITPRFLILDDGWQSVRKDEDEGRRLSGLCANEKFPGDLAKTVDASRTYGIDYFYVWHAFQGYWHGVDPKVMHEYGAQPMLPAFSDDMKALNPQFVANDGKTVGVVPPEMINRFYNDYHRHLMLQGVDGVKVDNQASLESTGEGHGGRVEMMQAYHEALEGSVHTHFLGGLINCMSCSNDMVYSALNSNITRSSTDFWPKRPETHGLHIYTNAVTSYWMGEFVVPDWDMFQSGHEMGRFHAIGRAVSGGPVYVSDKPGEHNADVLRALVFSDGTVATCGEAGLPSRDSLFANPLKEEVLLKVFNFNETTAVVAAFNCRYRPELTTPKSIAGTIRPSDADGLAGDHFAIYLQGAQTFTVCGMNDGLDVSLPDLTCDIATIAPIHDGFAAIGLTDKYNCGGAIADVQQVDNRTWQVDLHDGGEFLAWSRKQPKNVYVNGVGTTYDYTLQSGALRVTVDEEGPTTLTIVYGGK